jgi:hypothetical protein
VDAGDILQMIFFGFLGHGVPVLFWIGTLIFGIVMLRRGGGKPERFFITGSILNILATMLRIPVIYLPVWLHAIDYGSDTMSFITFGTGLFIDIIFALGLMSLLYAFWLKFNNSRIERSVSAETES